MILAGGIFAALSSVLAHAFLIMLTVVFILLEMADFPKKLRIVLKNPERSLSTIEKFSQHAKRYMVIKPSSAPPPVLRSGFGSSSSCRLSGTLGNALVFAELCTQYCAILAGLPVALLALVQLGMGSALLTVLGLLSCILSWVIS